MLYLEKLDPEDFVSLLKERSKHNRWLPDIAEELLSGWGGFSDYLEKDLRDLARAAVSLGEHELAETIERYLQGVEEDV